MTIFQARIHLVKRSYDKTIPEGKTAPFNLTCNAAKFFPPPSEKLMTKDGAFTMNQKFAEYQESQKKKREEDMHYAKNKRLILSKRDERHFKYPNFKGEDFSKVE